MSDSGIKKIVNQVNTVKSESKTILVNKSQTNLPKHREGPVKIEIPIFKAKNECNVIKIIQKEWDREIERLNTRKVQKPKN